MEGALESSQPRVLPRRFGVGIYISDSEDSCDSSVQRWAATETEKRGLPDVDCATTVYASALEESLSDGESSYPSRSSSELSFPVGDSDEEDFAKDTPFPESLKEQSDAAYVLNCTKATKILDRSLRFDLKLASLERKRNMACGKIQQEHLRRTTLAAFRCYKSSGVAERVEERKRVEEQGSESPRQSSERGSVSEETVSITGKVAMPASPVQPVNSAPDVSKSSVSAKPETEASSGINLEKIMQSLQVTQPSEQHPESIPVSAVSSQTDTQELPAVGFVPSADVGKESTPADVISTPHIVPVPVAPETVLQEPDSLDSTPAFDAGKQAAMAHNVAVQEAEEERERSSVQLPREQSPQPAARVQETPESSASVQNAPTEAKAPPRVVLSSELLRMSAEMKVPQSFPPPPTLFSLAVLQSQNATKEKETALHAASTAMEFEAYHKRIAHEMVHRMGSYAVDIANRSICKGIDKNMKLDISQISAQESQIRAKVHNILDTISQVAGSAGAIYAYVQFSRHLISKCAGISDSLVFAVAKTAVRVMERHPQILSILLSFLHEVSVLTVPKYYSSERIHDTLLEKLGFKDIPGFELRKETHDEFIARQAGYVKFYAAIVELNSSVHGLEFGWSYLSRMLNNLPPSRITASALMSFLNVAGHALFSKYKKQFFKVLLYIHSQFLVKLATSDDGEAQAVYSRLQTYLQKHQFTKRPEAKSMPDKAVSFRVHT